jgi:hypothetical protein
LTTTGWPRSASRRRSKAALPSPTIRSPCLTFLASSAGSLPVEDCGEAAELALVPLSARSPSPQAAMATAAAASTAIVASDRRGRDLRLPELLPWSTFYMTRPRAD